MAKVLIRQLLPKHPWFLRNYNEAEEQRMKIKYESVTGEITEVEVSEEIGAVIIDSRRKEENLARKERYHC